MTDRRLVHYRAVGSWAVDAVQVSHGPSSRQVVPEVEATIERAWKKLVSDRPGVRLFDGPMVRLEAFEATADRLTLSVSPTRYKPFLGTNLTDATLADRFGENVLADPIGVSTALLTSDGYLMMGRRNSWVAYYPNRLHPFAGALELRDGSGDVFGDVFRELEEELGLAREEVTQITCTGVVSDASLRQPELIFQATTTRTRAEVEACVDPDEHTACVAILADERDVEWTMADPTITPVGIATLALWGRLRFGDAWFARVTRNAHVPREQGSWQATT